jgi:hypothetical protein
MKASEAQIADEARWMGPKISSLMGSLMAIGARSEIAQRLSTDEKRDLMEAAIALGALYEGRKSARAGFAITFSLALKAMVPDASHIDAWNIAAALGWMPRDGELPLTKKETRDEE